MGLKSKIFITTIIIFAFFSITDAAWQGPVEIINGTWGPNNDQFGIKYGDTNDVFAGPIYIKAGQEIVIQDVINGRYKVYSADGMLKKTLKCIEVAPDVYNEECNFDGDYLKTTADGNIWTDQSEYKNPKYSLYSSTGQLIKTSATRPLDLGKVSEQRISANKYKITVTYPDKAYSLEMAGPFEKYVRDTNDFMYALSGKVVKKFGVCGKELGSLTIPENQLNIIKPSGRGFEAVAELIAEFGQPVVAPNGDIYTWKRTPDTYSILKWTWVDDPNDPPSGPDAPTGLTVMPSTTGLYLTWTASPQDPGCVTGYEVARATSAGGVYSTVTTVGKGVVKYNDTSASAGTTYYYKVRAKAGSEYSPYTGEVSGKR